jgi:hypothetical protein
MPTSKARRGCTGNHTFGTEERMSRTRTGNRSFAAEERMTRTRGYAGDRIYAGRDRFAESRGFNANRTFVIRDRVSETRGNRIYATAGYDNARYGGYGRTWRGDRFVGGVAAGVVAAASD